MLKVNTLLPLHSRKQNYTLQLANAALKIRIIAQSSLEGTSEWHLVQTTDQRKVNCQASLCCPEPYLVKSVRMQVSGQVAPSSL